MPKRTKSPDILSNTIEILELTIRAARRCAYDLKHCADSLSLVKGRREESKLFLERAHYFVKLFQHGNNCKDYRHHLHQTIAHQEHQLETLRALLATNKISDPTQLF